MSLYGGKFALSLRQTKLDKERRKKRKKLKMLRKAIKKQEQEEEKEMEITASDWSRTNDRYFEHVDDLYDHAKKMKMLKLAKEKTFMTEAKAWDNVKKTRGDPQHESMIDYGMGISKQMQNNRKKIDEQSQSLGVGLDQWVSDTLNTTL